MAAAMAGAVAMIEMPAVARNSRETMVNKLTSHPL
jgi:hypothetical protein